MATDIQYKIDFYRGLLERYISDMADRLVREGCLPEGCTLGKVIWEEDEQPQPTTENYELQWLNYLNSCREDALNYSPRVWSAIETIKNNIETIKNKYSTMEAWGSLRLVEEPKAAEGPPAVKFYYQDKVLLSGPVVDCTGDEILPPCQVEFVLDTSNLVHPDILDNPLSTRTLQKGDVVNVLSADLGTICYGMQWNQDNDSATYLVAHASWFRLLKPEQEVTAKDSGPVCTCDIFCGSCTCGRMQWERENGVSK